MFSLFFGGVGVFIGYQLGWVKGYDQKDQDDKRIEYEMSDFWKAVKKHGI
ncbi:hypothetical protein [Bacillus sp. ISL-7]|nr:hypothetical protein [Bacillus sp. ISL-7]MBT2735118.1 hypothetical protein [Bacillus sp. ISL-7]